MPGFQSRLPDIWRTTDTARINEIVNHPQVRPWVADLEEGEIDLAAQVANENTIVLLGEHGGFVLWRLLPGVYEVHTQILPNGRGDWALRFVQAGFRWMFTRTDAFEILTRVPAGHLAAKALAVASGFSFEFTADRRYRFRGKDVLVDVYSTQLQDWAARAPELEDTGRWLHSRFAEEGERIGLTGEWRGPAKERGVKWGPLHGDMPSHNRYVGLTYHMALGGNAARGVAMYNRWALASHRPVHLLSKLLSVQPPVVWFDHTELRLSPDGDVELSLEKEVTPWVA